MIYFHFSFFSTKIVKNRVWIFRLGPKVVLDRSKTHYLQHEQYSFFFRPHYARVLCLIIRLTINEITVTLTVTRRHWRLLIYALHTFLLRNRVQINVSWFRKYNPFLIFHDAVSPNQPENQDTKTYYKIEKRVFSLINAGWIASGILYIFF